MRREIGKIFFRYDTNNKVQNQVHEALAKEGFTLIPTDTPNDYVLYRKIETEKTDFVQIEN